MAAQTALQHLEDARIYLQQARSAALGHLNIANRQADDVPLIDNGVVADTRLRPRPPDGLRAAAAGPNEETIRGTVAEAMVAAPPQQMT